MKVNLLTFFTKLLQEIISFQLKNSLKSDMTKKKPQVEQKVL